MIEVPAERIAQIPAEPRESARMLVVHRVHRVHHEHALVDATCEDLATYIADGALLVANDSMLIPARLHASKAESGGKVEIVLLRREGPGFVERTVADGQETLRLDGDIWRALGKSSRPLQFDRDMPVGDDLSVRILGRAEDDGSLRVMLFSDRDPLEAVMDYGYAPLPPYIKRPIEELDLERSQSIFARSRGSVAIEPAGLHFSLRLLGHLAMHDISLTTVRVHLGVGSFEPLVGANGVEKKSPHPEPAEVCRTTIEAIAQARAAGRNVVAIGVSVLRALVAAAEPVLHPIAQEIDTRVLASVPGAAFCPADWLITSLAPPNTAPFAALVELLGLARVESIYSHALTAGYRFYALGDALLIDLRTTLN